MLQHFGHLESLPNIAFCCPKYYTRIKLEALKADEAALPEQGIFQSQPADPGVMRERAVM